MFDFGSFFWGLGIGLVIGAVIAEIRKRTLVRQLERSTKTILDYFRVVTQRDLKIKEYLNEIQELRELLHIKTGELK